MSESKRRILIEQFGMPSRGIYDGMPGSAFEEEDENTVPPPTPVDPSRK